MFLFRSPLPVLLYMCHLSLCTESEVPGVSYTLLEEEPVGTFVGIPAKDTPLYAHASLEMLKFDLSASNQHESLFQIGEMGKLFTASRINREQLCPSPQTVCEIDLQVNVEILHPGTDTYVPSTPIPVTISISDINDNQPEFSSFPYMLRVEENTTPSLPIITMTAEDEDLGVNSEITYSHSPKATTLERELFQINETGEVYLTRSLDYEHNRRIIFKVKAVDHGIPPLSSETVVFVNVIDVNDNPPVILGTVRVFDVAENAPNGSVIGHVVPSDLDSGTNGKVVCLTEDPIVILESTSMGNMLSVKVNAVLDREESARHEFSVTCSDQGDPSLTTTVNYTIQVVDVNDNAPVFEEEEYTLTITETSQAGEPVLRVHATDEDVDENGFVTYSLSPEGQKFFTIDTKLGDISPKEGVTDRSVTPPASIIVTAADRGVISLSSQVQVNIEITE